ARIAGFAAVGVGMLGACGGTSATSAPSGSASAPVTVSTALLTTVGSVVTAAQAATTAASPASASTATSVAAATAATTASSTASAVAAASKPAPTPTTGIVGTGNKAALKIQWMSYFNPQDIGRLGDTFLPSYEKDQKGVAVEVILGPGGIIDSQQKYLTLAAAGDPPDLFGNTRPATNLAQQGLYADLSSLIKRDHFDLTKYNQQWLQTQADYKGGVYGLPLSVHAEAPAMVYNRDLFQKAGVPEPPARWGDDAWTWETFLDAARRLTVPSATGTLTQAGVDSLAYSVHLPVLWEGNWVSQQLDTATCAAQPMIDTYTNYSDLTLKYKVMPGPTLKLAAGGFKGGTSAMSTMGSWEFGAYQALNTVNWAFMPFPKAKRSAYAFDPNMAYVAKSSKHLEETWNFVKWLDNGSYYALFFNFMPVIASDTATWSKTFFQNKPNVRPEVLVESLSLAQGIDPMFRVKGSDAFVRATVEPALASIVAGKAEVAATLQGVQPLLQGLIDQSPK
ncbi:MAG TPA: hypothetical protein VIU62_03090, partial [Chloroflexota bacterium]